MTIYAYTDGASRGNPGESGIGIILKDEKGEILYEGRGYIGKATNNVAEYRAFLACMKKALRIGCDRLIVHSDSQLLVRQMLGTYRVKDSVLKGFHAEAAELVRTAPFPVQMIHVGREQNTRADLLANEAIDRRRRLNR